jgi:hypothetical protein
MLAYLDFVRRKAAFMAAVQNINGNKTPLLQDMATMDKHEKGHTPDITVTNLCTKDCSPRMSFLLCYIYVAEGFRMRRSKPLRLPLPGMPKKGRQSVRLQVSHPGCLSVC